MQPRCGDRHGKAELDRAPSAICGNRINPRLISIIQTAGRNARINRLGDAVSIEFFGPFFGQQYPVNQLSVYIEGIMIYHGIGWQGVSKAGLDIVFSLISQGGPERDLCQSRPNISGHCQLFNYQACLFKCAKRLLRAQGNLWRILRDCSLCKTQG